MAHNVRVRHSPGRYQDPARRAGHGHGHPQHRPLASYASFCTLLLMLGAFLWRSRPANHTSLHTVSEGPSTPQIFVSLTTVNTTVDYLRFVLSSLLDQTVPPTRIYVALAEDVDAKHVHLWGKHSKVQVLRYKEDLGPAMKYIPAVQALRDKQDALLVIGDDDKVYPPTLLEDLLLAHRKHPHAAVGCRGWKAPADCVYGGENFCDFFAEEDPAKDCDWELRSSIYGHALKEGEDREVDVLTGSDAYAFPPSIFAADDSLWTFPTPVLKLAARMDDVWMSGHIARLKVPRLVVSCTSEAVDANLHLVPHGKIQMANMTRPVLNTALLKHFCPHWLSHSCKGCPKPGEEVRRTKYPRGLVLEETIAR